ncbi:MAG: hypothetical protein Q7U64_05760 [Desulfocapsaceae bacterium]|nr:hypothetical protein [Desulfocapsaceae bacterium]
MNKIKEILFFIFIISTCSFITFLDTAKANTVFSNNTISFELTNEIWLGKIVQSKSKNIFWGLGFSKNTHSSFYQLLKFSEQGVEKISELPLSTDEIQNPYLHIRQIIFFKLINDKLFIGIKKLNNNIQIVIVDTISSTKSPQTINLEPLTNSELLLSKQGDIYLLGLEKNNLIILQKISEKGEIVSKKFSLKPGQIKGIKISAALLLDDFIYLSIIGNPNNTNTTELLKIDINGSIQKNTTIEGIIFKLYPTMKDHLLAIKSGETLNDNAEAMIFANTLTKKQTYSLPSFYDIIRYEGSISPINDGGIFYIKQISEKPGDEAVNVFRYSYNQAPVTLAQIQNKSEQKSVVYNIINTKTDNMLTLGISYEEINDNKSQKFFKIYEIDTPSN